MDQDTITPTKTRVVFTNRLTKVLLIILGAMIIAGGGVYSYMHYSVNLKKEPYSLSDSKGLYYIQKVGEQYYLYYQRPGQPSNNVLIDSGSKINPADYVGKIVSINGKFTKNDTNVYINSLNVKE